MSTSAINGATPAANTPSSTPANPSVTSLANENVFLQLLVAQLKYQDPTQPADGTQFITQLAEFTNVSNTTQMTGDLNSMNTNLATLAAGLTPPATTGTTGTTGNNSNS